MDQFTVFLNGVRLLLEGCPMPEGLRIDELSVRIERQSAQPPWEEAPPTKLRADVSLTVKDI